MRIRLSLGIALALIGGQVRDAFAESSAFALVRFDSITMVDLAPGDGIAPSMTLANVSNYAASDVVNSDPAEGSAFDWTRRRTTFEALSSGSLVPAGFQVSALAQYSGGSLGSLRSDVDVALDGRATADVELKYDFVLSGHTSVTFDAALIGSSASVGPQAGGNEQVAWSYPGILFSGSLIPQGKQFVPSNLTVSPIGPDYGFAQLSDSLNVNFTITNDTDSAQTAQVWTFAAAHARNSSSVALVPELPSPAMMVPGLAVIGWFLRRKQRLSSRGLLRSGPMRQWVRWAVEL